MHFNLIKEISVAVVDISLMFYINHKPKHISSLICILYDKHSQLNIIQVRTEQ